MFLVIHSFIHSCNGRTNAMLPFFKRHDEEKQLIEGLLEFNFKIANHPLIKPSGQLLWMQNSKLVLLPLHVELYYGMMYAMWIIVRPRRSF